ncbi:MAG: RNA methyltransferase [Spirochaetia bacterium]|jgi:tRNA/rRNA methyltransferase|nr:RNA methyltransferase [Spirochaetia bacterium]
MERSKNLDRIQIVLVDTQDGANIGSVCRAMKTMGLSHLVLVTDSKYDEDRVRTLALHASDLWEHAQRFATLEEALASSIYTVGATRRRGKFRKADALSPQQLCDKVSVLGEGPVSIVFGRESDGLTDDEVNACSQIVTIPTSDAFPSLNLSQAVQVICYCLYDRLKPWPVEATPVDKTRIKQGVSNCVKNLDDIGYFKLDQEQMWTSRFLDDVFERAQLTESELKRLEKLFSKMSKIAFYKEH